MIDHTHCGKLFIALGILLLLAGLVLRPHFLALSPWPPYLIPALMSLCYGAYSLWRQKHPLP